MTDQTRPAADAAPSNWNLPNALTVLRILGVPVFLWLLLQEGGEDAGWRWWAFGVFALLMITDKIDGDLARSRNLVTDFGKIADPIADKALMIGALVGLNIIELLPWWITAIIVVRELGITLWRVVQLRRGHVVRRRRAASSRPWRSRWPWRCSSCRWRGCSGRRGSS